MGTNIKFLQSDTFPCDYMGDGRLATQDYYGHDFPQDRIFEEKVFAKTRKVRFSAVRKGLIGNTFSAASNNCISCNACVPLRINTAQFELTKKQRKVLNVFNQQFNGIKLWRSPRDMAEYTPHFYELYIKYLQNRFPRSEMKNVSVENLSIMLLSKTDLLILSNEDDRVFGFTQVDHQMDKDHNEATLDYIVYDPDHLNLSLGHVSFLETIKWATQKGISHVYIGATNASQALKYKKHYSGLETFDGKSWLPYDPEIHREGPDYNQITQDFGLNLP